MTFEADRVLGSRRPSVVAAVALGAALLAAAPAASAQSGGHLRLGVERMFGFTYNSITTSSVATFGGITTTREQSVTLLNLNLFGSGFSSAAVAGGLLAPATPPRLAIDYEFAGGLTVGGALFVSWGGASNDDATDDASVSAFGVGFAPRVGYTLALSRELSFWPRVGATLAYNRYSPQSSSSATSSSSYVPVWINIEPALTYAPDPHVLVSLALICDVPVAGAVSTTSTTSVGGVTTERTTESTLKLLSVGLEFGLTVRL